MWLGGEKMNIRQQKYKKNRLSGMNQFNAARAAGYSHSTARAKMGQFEQSAMVGMRSAFEQAGLTDKAIVEFALQGLNAKKVISADIYIKDIDGGELKVNKNSNDWIEVEDWAVRHKYFETILKLTDRLQQKVVHSGNVDGQTTKIMIIRSDEQKKESIENGVETKTISRQVYLQQESIPGNVEFVGNRQEYVNDISGHVVQRADT